MPIRLSPHDYLLMTCRIATVSAGFNLPAGSEDSKVKSGHVTEDASKQKVSFLSMLCYQNAYLNLQQAS
ncbi:hypothetical protein E6O75_ATG07277 [Venturia nashicola]|uniref:Uncharacterized protein n=1 Tax=Venturia nashicola TaxID=86259 RepID=A0A4Z1NF58_9PEZI|nr:hypothetical protein E6O75_ATG07277 [Venturia nashicola]